MLNDRKNLTSEIPGQARPGIRETGECYEIRVRGQLDESWSDWLEGLEMELLDNGEMILRGRLADQASLMGILTRLHGLNLALLSLGRPDKNLDSIQNLKED